MAKLDNTALNQTLEFCLKQEVVSPSDAARIRHQINKLIEYCGPYEFDTFDATQKRPSTFEITGYDHNKGARIITKCYIPRSSNDSHIQIKMKHPTNY